MARFEVGKVYNWEERGFDSFTVLSRTDKSITVCNGTNTWRMMIRTDERGEWVCDSSQPRYAQNMFISRPEYAGSSGKYGYLISYKNNKGKVIISSENGYDSTDQAEFFMNSTAKYLALFGFTILSKALLENNIVCETF